MDDLHERKLGKKWKTMIYKLFCEVPLFAELLFCLMYVKNGYVAVFRARKFLRNSDLIYVRDIYSLLWLPTNRKVILTLANNGEVSKMILERFPGMFLSTGLLEILIKRILSKADCIVLLSQSAKDLFQSRYGYLTNTEVIFNGVGTAPVQGRPMSSPVRFITVGSLVKRKGHHTLIRAIEILSRKGLKVELRLVGDGPHRKVLERIAGKSEAIKFLGKLNKDDVYSELACADFYIQGSQDEGMPLSVIEGMMHGLPLILSRVASHPEMVKEGATGFLFEYDNHVELSEIIEYCTAMKPSVYNSFVNEVRSAYLENFTHSEHLRKFCFLIGKVLNK